MHKYKNTIFYSAIIIVFSCIMYVTFINGKALEVDVKNIASDKNDWQEFIDSFISNLHHPLALLLMQIIAIVIVARIFGWLFNKIGQPAVIGEIIAGIVLGPSLFGMYFPETSAVLFPLDSLGNLQLLSQVGLILFMFVIGMELDLKILKSIAQDAVVISHASIVIPFALGMVLAYYTYAYFAPEGINFLSFSLFMGIAMSITAFPVLARIVQERGIQKTKLGTVVLTAAAADDITAWCILAVVIAIVKAGSFVSALYVIAMAILYVILMLKLVRPFLRHIGNLNANNKTLSKPVVALFLLVLILSSYLTEIIGIHALFGAFMAGAIMPDNNKFRHIFVEKVEDVAVILFLPLFFVYTGLRTEIGLLNDIYLWKMTGIIILVAVIGKFVGSAFAAKYVGQSWKDSLSIGALMNTRGLMELVALNIGFELGVLTPEVFAMMVIMALVTTFMTGPVLDLLNKIFKDKSQSTDEILNETKFKILFYFDQISAGKNLLKLAHTFTKNKQENSVVTALHLLNSSDVDLMDNKYEQKIFLPLEEEARKINQKLINLYKVSYDVNSEIVDVAHKGNYDLVLIELGSSIYDGTILGRLLGFTTRIVNPEIIVDKVIGKEKFFDYSPFDDQTRYVITNSRIPVGIFIDKNLEEVNKIFLPFFHESDNKLIPFILKFIQNNDSQIVIMDIKGHLKTNTFIKEEIRLIEQAKPNHISVLSDVEIDLNLIQQHDLILTTVKSWRNMIDKKYNWLKNTTSLLLIKS